MKTAPRSLKNPISLFFLSACTPLRRNGNGETGFPESKSQGLPVCGLLQIKYGDTATSEGVLFATYSALIGESQAGGQHRTRIKQILDWCKPDFDGVVSFV